MEYTATAGPAAAISFAPAATTWLKLAVVYLIVGVGLGIVMGSTEDSRCVRSTRT